MKNRWFIIILVLIAILALIAYKRGWRLYVPTQEVKASENAILSLSEHTHHEPVIDQNKLLQEELERYNHPTVEIVEQEIRKQAKEYGVDVGTALRIAFAESNYIHDAKNFSNSDGTNDKGVYQINSIHGIPDSCRLDYKCNIKWAMEKMNREGFSAWNSSKSKWAY